MPILKLDSIHGIGGEMKLSQPLHCHFKPFSKEDFSFAKKNDALFLRHLTIFLLDKYFRLTKHYTERHIPMPLGYAHSSDNVPIGILSEFVYGLETSHYYNEHLEWDSAAKAFKEFGFYALDYDLFSGFSGEADSVSHNFFSQSDFFPTEQQKVFSAPSHMPWLPDRYATAHWMRIDFSETSFPFDADIFLKAFEVQKEKLQHVLTKEEFYFLTQYTRIQKNQEIENAEAFHACILAIRQQPDNLKAIYDLQDIFHSKSEISTLGLKKFGAFAEKTNSFDSSQSGTHLCSLEKKFS